jgi:hypothetical protein
MRGKYKVWGYLCAAALAACVGCGTRLQPAGGKVLVDGKPVKGGTIMFYPVNKGRPASARILEDGSFALSYERPDDGLPVGDYKVVIVSDVWKEGKKSRKQEYDEANMKRQGIVDTSALSGGTLTHIVPPVYNDITTTPLTQTVASSGSAQQYVYDIPSKVEK